MCFPYLAGAAASMAAHASRHPGASQQPRLHRASRVRTAVREPELQPTRGAEVLLRAGLARPALEAERLPRPAGTRTAPREKKRD